MKSLLAWLDDRTGYKDLLNEALYERVPGGARWRYVWGSTLSFTFFVQMITGICLWMAYSPGANTAWESVYYIQHQMTMGWVLRGIHHFAAQAMIILLILHLMQVMIDGAYKAPREVNFWLGLVLMQIVMFLGLTGYLLPWDQKGYYATQVATKIMGSAPIVGPQLQQLVQGGSEYGHHTLTRFFALHAGVLPLTLMGFLALHIHVFRRHGIKAVAPEGKPDGMFWPDQILKDGVACLAVMAAILTATLYWHGAELTAPANPAEAYGAARPEWYYLFLFRFLKFPLVSQMGEATGLGEALGAIFIPGAAMTVLVLAPLIAYFKWGHKFNMAYLWTILGIAGVLTGMAYYEDWYSEAEAGKEFRKSVAMAHRDGARAVELAKSPTGIPPQGAITLLRNDPLTQGPGIFVQYCMSCHQPAEWSEKFTETPKAPELANPLNRLEVTFADRDWIRSVLSDFSNHFATLKNITGTNAEKATAILEGSMHDWSDSNRETLKAEENTDDFAALVEFLYAQSKRADAKQPDDPQVLRGKEIFISGEMTAGTIDACVDCHSMHALTVEGEGIARKLVLEAAPLSTDMQPVLTNYGGADWLKAFIADPQSHYAGESGNNAMPGFADQLSEQQLEMVARWLAKDYYLANPTGAPEVHE